MALLLLPALYTFVHLSHIEILFLLAFGRKDTQPLCEGRAFSIFYSIG